MLGTMSAFPTPEGIDPDALVRRWTPEAEAGDTDAMLRLCTAYLMKQDLDAGELWAQRLAGDGNVVGMRFLAQIREVRGDEAGALEWNRRADEAYGRTLAGHGAARLMGPAVERFGEDPDPEQLRTAAQAGDVLAMTVLGMMLSMEGDFTQAARWLTPGAEAGDALAVFGLSAVLSAQGDDEGAARWLELGAANGDSLMMDLLGELAAQAGDEEKARYWKDKAQQAFAEEGDAG
jgi:TPR repeat protein